MSAAESTDVKFETNSEHYTAALDAYKRASNRRAVTIDFIQHELPALGSPAVGDAAPNHGALRVLSVGPGDGDIDIQILIKLRQREQRHIQAVIVEPDPLAIGRYKARAVRESDKVQGIDFEWRQETMEAFQESRTGQDEKFHFVNLVSTVYYFEDKEKSLRYLYDKLDVGGVLIITVMSAGSGEGGFAKFWQYHGERRGQDHLCDSFDVIKYLKNQCMPVWETVALSCYLNITPCFASPLQELSGDGSLLLDFLTYTLDFAKNAPVEDQESVMEFLGSEEYSARDASGRVLLNADNVLLVVRANGLGPIS